MRKPRVAILTSLVDYSPAYSLVGIILDQCRMLKRAGYDYDLLCLKNFNRLDWGAPEIDKELSVKYILPQTRLHDYQPREKAKDAYEDENGNLVLGFEQQATAHFEGDPERGWIGYREALAEYDVVIDHDLMFLSWHLPQNAALRRCIKLWPQKTWIHWVHSGPSCQPSNGACYPSTLRYSAAPNSTYVYLNHSQKHEYALMIGALDRDVAVVYNPKDVRDVQGFDELTCNIIDKYDLFDHQALQVYPFSTPRWRDKGVRQLMRIFGAMKKQGVRARLVLVNAHCNSPKDRRDVSAMHAYAKVCKLERGQDVIFTSDYADKVEDKGLRYTVPFRSVRELVEISNLFVFPSASECCSLIQAEASTAGKFMVLNRDFGPMLEFCSDDVLHFKFTINDPDKNPVYYTDVAREIWANMRAEASVMNRTQAITRTYNRDWIFRNQLEPLLYRGVSESVSGKQTTEEVVAVDAKPVCHGDHVDKHRYAEYTAENNPVIDVEERMVEIEMEIVDDEPGDGLKILTPDLKKDREPCFESPWDGMDCPIFDACSAEQRAECYEQAGKCLVLDEIGYGDHKKRSR